MSNNSVDAISEYLDLHDLRSSTDTVAARINADVRLLKPNSHLVDEAITALDLPSVSCTLVGDSPTDIEAARAANVRSLGYANKPGKTEALSRLRPNAITTTMTILADACTAGQ